MGLLDEFFKKFCFRGLSKETESNQNNGTHMVSSLRNSPSEDKKMYSIILLRAFLPISRIIPAIQARLKQSLFDFISLLHTIHYRCDYISVK